MSAALNSADSSKVVLIGVCKDKYDEPLVKEYLDELAFLAETAGLIPVKKFMQQLHKPQSATYIRKGKAEEVHKYIMKEKVGIAIFDDSLSPTQVRNLEKIFEVRVIDRSNLILDIFAGRAKTAYAKTQVELAQYEYLLPRLAGMWLHLERQKGGIGLRGPGEREIETDRRIARQKIAKLREKLRIIDKQMATQRKNRGFLVRVALVGYTNAGKSTIMNLISKSDVFAENKLFATLDTTVRKVVLERIPFLISDTVGFIRKLPHQLIESFKSTLDEVREADILVHVVDVSHLSFESQVYTVNETLAELKVVDKPMIMLFNKTDLYTNLEAGEFDYTASSNHNINLPELKRSWINKNSLPTVFISAKMKSNIDEFRKVLYSMVRELHMRRYPNYLTGKDEWK